ERPDPADARPPHHPRRDAASDAARLGLPRPRLHRPDGRVARAPAGRRAGRADARLRPAARVRHLHRRGGDRHAGAPRGQAAGAGQRRLRRAHRNHRPAHGPPGGSPALARGPARRSRARRRGAARRPGPDPRRPRALRDDDRPAQSLGRGRGGGRRRGTAPPAGRDEQLRRARDRPPLGPGDGRLGVFQQVPGGCSGHRLRARRAGEPGALRRRQPLREPRPARPVARPREGRAVAVHPARAGRGCVGGGLAPARGRGRPSGPARAVHGELPHAAVRHAPPRLRALSGGGGAGSGHRDLPDAGPPPPIAVRALLRRARGPGLPDLPGQADPGRNLPDRLYRRARSPRLRSVVGRRGGDVAGRL
ncbi:MAG: 2-aminoethylphosphonate:pyruvate aminotransferase, partial [uncultured Acetobacteraceae bacterium]